MYRLQPLSVWLNDTSGCNATPSGCLKKPKSSAFFFKWPGMWQIDGWKILAFAHDSRNECGTLAKPQINDKPLADAASTTLLSKVW